MASRWLLAGQYNNQEPTDLSRLSEADGYKKGGEGGALENGVPGCSGSPAEEEVRCGHPKLDLCDCGAADTEEVVGCQPPQLPPA